MVTETIRYTPKTAVVVEIYKEGDPPTHHETKPVDWKISFVDGHCTHNRDYVQIANDYAVEKGFEVEPPFWNILISDKTFVTADGKQIVKGSPDTRMCKLKGHIMLVRYQRYYEWESLTFGDIGSCTADEMPHVQHRKEVEREREARAARTA